MSSTNAKPGSSAGSISIPRIKLNDGNSIPVIGFGTGTAYYGQDCLSAVSGALGTGFNSLDFAQQYRNSEYAGEAIKRWRGKREDLFILTKFGVPQGGPEVSEPRSVLKAELEKLGVDYVDMYLIHNPNQSFAGRSYDEVWKTMEALKKEGLTKSIGISNFMLEHLEKLEKVWTVPPTVNQIKFHPQEAFNSDKQKVKEFCDAHQIRLQAYGPLSPLKSTSQDTDKVLRAAEAIAEAKGFTPGQVLLAWAAQYGGGTVVTTSRDEGRRREMLETFTKMSPLTSEQVDQISSAAR